MIILRQKEYTWKDKKAIQEFYEATNLGKNYPRGFNNLNVRDMIKAQELTKSIGDDLGNLRSNSPYAKELLEKAGLPNTADNIDHLVKKYINPDPELIERFIRISRLRDKKGEIKHKSLQKRLDIVQRNYLDKIGKVDNQAREMNLQFNKRDNERLKKNN